MSSCRKALVHLPTELDFVIQCAGRLARRGRIDGIES
jgi:hypothetical protein